jgi:hypothetical protein
MDPLVVVTHPAALRLEAREIQHDVVPEGHLAMGYYFEGKLIARGIIAAETVEAIQALVEEPVTLALAATEDDQGNVDGRVCLMLPVDPSELQDDDAPDEPWKESVPAPPEPDEEDADRPHVVLLPIGNVVRGARDRNHPEDVAGDAREMLANLLAGRGQDAVAKAIDDLLGSL